MYAQRAYAIANPGAWLVYGDRRWVLTASDGPANTTLTLAGRSRTFHTYWARGASFTDLEDDGTIAPTAAGGSIPFAPESALPALWAVRDKYGGNLHPTDGLLDPFNTPFTAVG